MKKKDKVEISGERLEIIEVNGIKYLPSKETFKDIDGVKHLDKIIYKSFDEKEFKENLEVVIKALCNKTTTKELLRDLLKSINRKELKAVVEELKKKKKIKKQKGCLGFKIGKSYLQIIN